MALNPLAGQTLKSFTAKVTAEALQEVDDLIESRRIAPVIDRAYPLSQAAEAIGYLDKGHARGKVVVTV